MATSETHRSVTADDRAWDVFFEALDAESPAASRIPSGAAIVASDAPDRHDLVSRYHGEHRTVVLVDATGGFKVLRPPVVDWERLLELLSGVIRWVRSHAVTHAKV